MNPTGQPEPFAQPPPSNGNDELQAPAIFVLVVAGISILFVILGLLISVLGLGGDMMNKMMEQADLPPALRGMQNAGASIVNIVVNLVQLAAYGVAVFGALQMRNRKNWGLAVAASIIVMVPCSCCCVIGLPAGIWSLVILMKPEIKAQFS